MLMVNGVELIALNEPLQMREFEGDDTVRLQKKLHSAHEIVKIRHLGKDIVADDEIGPQTFCHHLLCQRRAEEFDSRGDALLDSSFRHIGGRLYAKHRNTKRQEMLQQISVIAGKLDGEA